MLKKGGQNSIAHSTLTANSLAAQISTFCSLAWAAQIVSKATDEQACWHSPERQPGDDRLLQLLAAHGIGKS
jgi:hypothetical protein